NAVSVDGAGNVYVAGRFRHDSVRIGNTATAFQPLGPSWQSNSFLVALDANGNPQWVERGALAYFEEIAANGNGEIYCSGIASGYNTASAGLVALMDTTFTVALNQNQPFILKVDANGQRIGLHLESAANSVSTSAITLNPAGEPILVNQVYSDITIMGNLLSSPNIGSIYVQKFDTDLNPEWVEFGQGGNISPNTNWGVFETDIASDQYGNYFLGGGYQGTMTMGAITITSLSALDQDSLDSWVAMIADQNYTLPADSVWPGDTDYDGVANNADLLPIGLAYGTNGSTRPSASILWQGQPSPDWFQSQASGINYKHIDTDGDGIITDDDTLAIHQNYGLLHQRLSDIKSTGPLVWLDFTEDTLLAGDTATLVINLGTDTLPADSIHGLAFTVSYDSTLIDPNSITVSYDQSWLGTVGANMLKLDKNFPAQEQLDMALTRIDQQNQNGFGEIARIRLIMVDDLTAKADIAESLSLDIQNVFAVSADGSELDLGTQGDSVVIFQEDTSSTAIRPDWHKQITVFPNPTQETISIQLDNLRAQRIQLLDMRGSVLRSSTPNRQYLQWDVQALPAGMYLLEIQTEKGRYRQKIWKQ
ncbi:MAG: T9SS type A sorting domain-containing protein, partial [Bacteroidota bacterium]